MSNIIRQWQKLNWGARQALDEIGDMYPSALTASGKRVDFYGFRIIIPNLHCAVSRTSPTLPCVGLTRQG